MANQPGMRPGPDEAPDGVPSSRLLPSSLKPQASSLLTPGLALGYAIVAVLGAGVLTIWFFNRGWGNYSLFPLVLGALTVLARFPSAPLIMLLTLVAMTFVEPWVIDGWGWWRIAGPSITEAWIAAVALLAFVIADTRYLGIARELIPSPGRPARPPRPRGRRRTRLFRQRAARAPDGSADGRKDRWRFRLPRRSAPPVLGHRRQTVPPVDRRELAGLAVSAILWPTIGLAVLALIYREVEDGGWFGLGLSAWQTVVLLWALAGGALAARAVVGYLSVRWMTPEQADLALRDTLWRQTRKLQRSLNRHLRRLALGSMARREVE